MTDRFSTLTVFLKEDTREDDCEPLIDAIRMFKGVLDVKGGVSDIEEHLAFTRVRSDLANKIMKLFYPDK
jgi:hypothetical protein